MDIPGTKRADEELREHDEQKARHEETIREHEDHPFDGVAYHDMKEAQMREQEDNGFIRNKERGARREDHVETHELTEEANTILRNE